MRHRFALVAAVAACLLPSLARRLSDPVGLASGCVPAGRGGPIRGWIGCKADGGASRPLSDVERFVLGFPLDPNLAGEEALALVPGLSRRLAQELIRDRARFGAFASLEELDRVRGIGPRRIARARAFLQVGASGP
jgi:competence protein ComEA